MMQEEEWKKPEKNPILFDDPDELPVLSGHDDPLDSIKTICSNCAGTNGSHTTECDEDFT